MFREEIRAGIAGTRQGKGSICLYIFLLLCSLPNAVAQSSLNGAGLYVPCPLSLFLVSYRKGAGQDERLRSSLRLIPHELKTSVIYLPNSRDNEV